MGADGRGIPKEERREQGALLPASSRGRAYFFFFAFFFDANALTPFRHSDTITTGPETSDGFRQTWLLGFERIGPHFAEPLIAFQRGGN